jgi:hypothetical protein
MSLDIASACDKRNASLRQQVADYWTKKSLTPWNLLPFLGPVMDEVLPFAGDEPSNLDDLKDAGALLAKRTQEWQNEITSNQAETDAALGDLVAQLPALVNSSVQDATEPLRETTVIISIYLVFLGVLVGIVVMYYA